MIPPLNNTYGLHALVEYARDGGGSEKNVDAGFKTFKNDVGPNVLVYEPSPGKMTELFSSGQADHRGVGQRPRQVLLRHGLPGGFAYPKEGAYALLSSVCPVAKPDANPLAQAFVNYLVSPEVQEQAGQQLWLWPRQQEGQGQGRSQRAAAHRRARRQAHRDRLGHRQRRTGTTGTSAGRARSSAEGIGAAPRRSPAFMSYLVLNGLSKRYGDSRRPWTTSSLSVNQGEFISLLGPSGCGKTTTHLQMIAGFVEPSAGSIVLDGKRRQQHARQQARPGHGVPELRARFPT